MRSMELDDDEIDFILRRRNHISLKKNTQEKRNICHHVFVYTGHGHNYSIYTCSKCGTEEER